MHGCPRKPLLASAVGTICLLGTLWAGDARSEDGPLPNIKIGGYAKVDLIQDLTANGNAFQFKTDAIPIDGTPAADQSGQTTVHARESRLTVTLHEDTDRGPLKAYFEGDFFGDNNAFRLRQAYGEYAGFLGGQTWTTFMDISARPRSLDYEGPDGEIFVRQAMIRYTRALSDGWKFAVAFEQPGGQFGVPDTLDGTARSYVPDIPVHLRREFGGGHFQIAGIVRQIRFDGEGSSGDVSTAGYGANVSFKINTAGKSAIMGMAGAGKGIGRYVEALNGQSADAAFSGLRTLDALASQTAVLGYEQHWSPVLQSTLAFALTHLDGNSLLSGGAIESTQDARANLIWAADKRVDFGGEVLWGRRENQNGASGEAWRIQFSLIYKIG